MIRVKRNNKEYNITIREAKTTDEIVACANAGADALRHNPAYNFIFQDVPLDRKLYALEWFLSCRMQLVTMQNGTTMLVEARAADTDSNSDQAACEIIGTVSFVSGNVIPTLVRKSKTVKMNI